MAPTDIMVRCWKSQHTTYPEGTWVRDYWNDLTAPHRLDLMTVLGHLEPFQSLSEYGCNAGPNLRLVHQRWPAVTLSGWDVNETAMAYGRRQAIEEGWDFQPAMVPSDIILTCYTLTYIDSADIPGTLKALLDLTKKALVICEPGVPYDTAEQALPMKPGTGYPEWWYNYPQRLQGLCPEVRVYPLPRPLHKMTQVVVAMKE